MADEFDARVTSREAAAVADSYRLQGKVLRILWPLMEEARVSWPSVEWPSTEEELRRNIGVWYRDRGRMATQIWELMTFRS